MSSEKVFLDLENQLKYLLESILALIQSRESFLKIQKELAVGRTQVPIGQRTILQSPLTAGYIEQWFFLSEAIAIGRLFQEKDSLSLFSFLDRLKKNQTLVKTEVEKRVLAQYTDISSNQAQVYVEDLWKQALEDGQTLDSQIDLDREKGIQVFKPLKKHIDKGIRHRDTSYQNRLNQKDKSLADDDARELGQNCLDFLKQFARRHEAIFNIQLQIFTLDRAVGNVKELDENLKKYAIL